MNPVSPNHQIKPFVTILVVLISKEFCFYHHSYFILISFTWVSAWVNGFSFIQNSNRVLKVEKLKNWKNSSFCDIIKSKQRFPKDFKMLLFERRYNENKNEKLYLRVTYDPLLPKQDLPNISKLSIKYLHRHHIIFYFQHDSYFKWFKF